MRLHPMGLSRTLIAMLFLSSCNSQVQDRPLTTGSFQAVTARDLRIVTGQKVYVPAYSEVFYGQQDRNLELAVTLAIHNTDLDAPIIIQSVRYYDTDGNIVRDYISEPVEVSPLATTGFLVEDGDRSGGWGANFVVEWVAEDAVYEPVIEAIMISTEGTQGISMISLGRVISQTTPEEIATTDTGFD
ncbi:MAG: DUF3124 domain-containing protein [Anaerolineae bacterium]|nr:DUF3124 domain-containing protein [Anaerolineae bacterium]